MNKVIKMKLNLYVPFSFKIHSNKSSGYSRINKNLNSQDRLLGEILENTFINYILADTFFLEPFSNY